MESQEQDGYKATVRAAIGGLIERKLRDLGREHAAQGITASRTDIIEQMEREMPVALARAQAETGWPREHKELQAEIAFELLMELRKMAR